MQKNNLAKTLRTVDLFSGCGGLSLGFKNAGFNLIAAYDNWELAIETYNSNFNHKAYLANLRKPEEVAKHIRQFKPDVLIGGPPCQDFSIAGKRKELHRADLTISFAKIASLVKPPLVVMENVYNIEKSRSLQKALAILKKHNYGITTKIIDASRTGVPQMRRRFFLVALKNAPDDVFANCLESGLSKERMNVFDFFGNSLGTEYYYAHPRSYQRRAVFSIHEPSATIRRVNRPIPKNYKRHPADKTNISNGVRPLTTKERAQIQTFPKTFIFHGSKSQQEQLIANAVPVKLSQYVAERILVYLKSTKKINVR
jgi:DNA (cytosine-5)-methyltransferase 1